MFGHQATRFVTIGFKADIHVRQINHVLTIGDVKIGGRAIVPFRGIIGMKIVIDRAVIFEDASAHQALKRERLMQFILADSCRVRIGDGRIPLNAIIVIVCEFRLRIADSNDKSHISTPILSLTMTVKSLSPP